MPERREERIAIKISGINDTLYGLTDQIAELKEKYGVDIWQEVIEYIKEKKEVNK